ncbi:MFS transporter [Cupriavidus gilardii]|uniref:MFS transporter n=1 Tax=Cupriavidus gilardii TaxID=82541 RepID=A0A849B675_9BURK|nr:MFS transporter [Cupriavidus gilardii]KAB0599486.1 MFS transporter [Cupriavidus gilardii]MCT9013009.1 MFS transporter [Cupriavidus gilardii]MCT9052563.1 MFS transporter [Cupriavidus gilardii]NNH10742.1 MFS transporter [Cupriavidus gilardii]USE77871.1 MFS transporter [Cupriavidus gilardii]
MPSSPALAPSASHAPAMPATLVALFSLCAGVLVANLYYAQPLIELIGPQIGLSPSHASLIVSLTQIGYAVGLFFLVPLADLYENRRLLLLSGTAATASLVAAALSTQPGPFLLVSLLLGLSSVSVQILIPLAAHLAPEATRGRTVGTIMGGLLSGILLARPLSSLLAEALGWRAVFVAAAAMTLATVAIIALTLPRRVPEHRARYLELLASLWHLLMRFPLLRQRALYQGLLFAAFTLFWTAVPLELAGRHGLSQAQIGVFALVGALGAVAAPVAGRLADAGHTRIASLAAMALAALSFVPGLATGPYGVYALAATGIVLDFAVQMNMVLGQRAIYALDAASRARLNALYMTAIFIGGAAGSAVASLVYAQAEWRGIVMTGSGLAATALVAFVSVAGMRR